MIVAARQPPRWRRIRQRRVLESSGHGFNCGRQTREHLLGYVHTQVPARREILLEGFQEPALAAADLGYTEARQDDFGNQPVSAIILVDRVGEVGQMMVDKGFDT